MVFRGTGGNQLSLTYKGETVENRLLIGGGGGGAIECQKNLTGIHE